jgi:uncharacterized membrane protein YdjX (TVP38/TMEM64 family)
VIAVFCVVGFLGPLAGRRGSGPISGGPGVRAAVVFIGVYAGLTMACVPGPVLAGLSGVLFGTLEGSLLALVGAVLGASLAFLVARHVAGDLVARVGGRRVTALAAWVEGRGFRSMVFARAAPGAPFAAVSYAAGLAPVRLRDFALATGIVAIPRTFAYAAIGGSADHLRSPAVAIAGFVILGVGALGLVLGLREYAGVRRAARAGGREVEGTAVGGAAVGGVPVGGGGVRVGGGIVGVSVAGGTGSLS